MRKKRYQSYTCLTLFRQDLTELVTLFQTQLQDVEIIIDDHNIRDSAQLEQFEPTYQARSFLARGYAHTVMGEHSAPQFVELRMTKVSAMLLHWQESGQAEPAVLGPIKSMLVRCLTNRQQWIIAGGSWILVTLPLALLPVWQQHQITANMEALLMIGSICVLIPIALLLNARLVLRLKLETLVFLFPGAGRTTRGYGWREAWSRLVISVVVFICLVMGLMLALDFLWR